MERIDELRETWEKAYKVLVNDLGNQLTFEDVACMFFELGWRAADESMIDHACEWLKENIDLYSYNAFNTKSSYTEITLTDEFETAFRQAMKGEL